MPDMTVDDAIHSVASRVLHDIVHAAIDTGIDWALYPEIGEHDWQAVMTRVAEVACSEMMYRCRDYKAAYDLLAARADAVTDA